MNEIGEQTSLRHRLTRARTGAVLGAGIGLLTGAALAIVWTDAETSTLFWLTLLVIPLGLFGSALGHTIGGGRLAKPLIDTAGSDIAADRVKRAVHGQPTDLSPAEQDRAARYAAVAAQVIPAQAHRWALFCAALVSGQGLRLLLALLPGTTPPDLVTTGLLGLGTALLTAALAPQYFRAARQARAYARTHPMTSTPAAPRP